MNRLDERTNERTNERTSERTIERPNHKSFEEHRNLFPDALKSGLSSDSSRLNEIGSTAARDNSESVYTTDKESAPPASHNAPRKDIWDKIAALAPIISGLLIFVTGGWFTFSYNQQQLKLQEIQTIEKFIPHLTGNEQSKKAAILAISSLTDAELASKVAAIFASRGTVSALQSIAATGSERDKTIATKALAEALENLAAREMRLTEIETAYKQALDSKNTQGQAQSDRPSVQTQGQGGQPAQIATQTQASSRLAPNTLPLSDPEKFSDREIISNLNKLADFYTARGKYDQAEPLLKRSLTLSEHAFGTDSAQAAEVIRTLSALYKLKGDSVKADQFAKRARSIDPPDAKALRNETTESGSVSASAGDQESRAGEADGRPVEQNEGKSTADRAESQ